MVFGHYSIIMGGGYFMKRCGNCGKQNEGDNKYCTYCGKAIGKSTIHVCLRKKYAIKSKCFMGVYSYMKSRG